MKEKLNKQLTFKLSTSQMQRLTQIAKDINWTKGAIMRVALGNFLAYRKRFFKKDGRYYPKSFRGLNTIKKETLK